MGGDGGTKSLQRKFIRGAQDKQGWKGWGLGEAAATSKAELARTRASQCALTQKPLAEPIACCRLGNLFNKNELVLALQAKAVEGIPLPVAFKHIKNLNDIATLRFTPNPAAVKFDKEAKEAGARGGSSKAVVAATMEDVRLGNDERPSKFMCPVTRLEFNGRNRFCAVFEPGGTAPVLAERCLKRMKPEDLQDEVGRAFTMEECVLLCPDQKEYAQMRTALAAEMKAAKARRKEEKARKKLMKRKATGDGGSADSAAAGTPDSDAAAALKRSKKASKKARASAKAQPEVSTTLAYANIGKEAEARVNEMQKKNAVFASIFNDDKRVTGKEVAKDREKQANLFIRIAGRMY